MYPKLRLEALTDGVFAVAMTLLVLDLHLPDGFEPHNTNEMLHGLVALLPKFWPYVLSFVVLGMRWLSNIRVRGQGEHFGHAYVNWWLGYLLLITCVPFTTSVLGRFPGLAPSIWLYAANTILLATVAFRLMALTPDIAADDLRVRRVALILLIVSSLLAVGGSFVDPAQAMWALFLNFGAGAFQQRKRKTA